MSPEAQRKAIARSCGIAVWKGWSWSDSGYLVNGELMQSLDPLEDLNVSRMLRSLLTEKQRRRYCQKLWRFNSKGGQTVHWRLTDATAAQHAMAYLWAIDKLDNTK